MRTNHILIDWENVQPDSLELLNREDVRVYLFTGALQKSIPTSTAAALQPLGSRAQYIQMARSGRNALDFHIAFYIGRLSATEENPYFHVIAKDKDLDVLIEHLKAQKIFCTRSVNVTDMPFIKLSVAKSPTSPATSRCRPRRVRSSPSRAATSWRWSRAACTWRAWS